MLLTNKCAQHALGIQKLANLLNKRNTFTRLATGAALQMREGSNRFWCSSSNKSSSSCYTNSVLYQTSRRAEATGVGNWWNYSKQQQSRFLATVAVKKTKMVAKLTEQERSEKLQPLLDAGWCMVEGRDAIYKEFMLKDFNQAFSLMTGVALLAEKSNHHPEWFNCYNKLQVTLSTHDVGGISSNDIRMANYLEAQVKLLN